MFEKLLADLPYNPTLTKQVGFYARHLRHEESIRRTGLIFIGLAFLVQFFAVVSPPQSSSAYANRNPDSSSSVVSTANAASGIVEHITAEDVTTASSNANNTTVQPGDVISYTLFAENRSPVDVTDFAVQVNLSDVFDYASIVDLHGGTVADNTLVNWPASTIKSATTLTHQITVRVKNPISTNAPPVGNSPHLDYIMTTVYGNIVNVRLPLPVGISSLVTVSSNLDLPGTSRGEGLLLAAAILIVSGYFLGRARLLVNESMIIIQEAHGGSL